MCIDGEEHDTHTMEEIMPDGSRRPMLTCVKCNAVWSL